LIVPSYFLKSKSEMKKALLFIISLFATSLCVLLACFMMQSEIWTIINESRYSSIIKGFFILSIIATSLFVRNKKCFNHN